MIGESEFVKSLRGLGMVPVPPRTALRLSWDRNATPSGKEYLDLNHHLGTFASPHFFRTTTRRRATELSGARPNREAPSWPGASNEFLLVWFHITATYFSVLPTSFFRSLSVGGLKPVVRNIATPILELRSKDRSAR